MQNRTSLMRGAMGGLSGSGGLGCSGSATTAPTSGVCSSSDPTGTVTRATANVEGWNNDEIQEVVEKFMAMPGYNGVPLNTVKSSGIHENKHQSKKYLEKASAKKQEAQNKMEKIAKVSSAKKQASIKKTAGEKMALKTVAAAAKRSGTPVAALKSAKKLKTAKKILGQDGAVTVDSAAQSSPSTESEVSYKVLEAPAQMAAQSEGESEETKSGYRYTFDLGNNSIKEVADIS